MHHAANRGIPVPDWAEPYVIALLALAAIFLLWWAFRCLRKRDDPKKVRVGNAIGFTGFALAGVGGTLAGWSRH